MVTTNIIKEVIKRYLLKSVVYSKLVNLKNVLKVFIRSLISYIFSSLDLSNRLIYYIYEADIYEKIVLLIILD